MPREFAPIPPRRESRTIPAQDEEENTVAFKPWPGLLAALLLQGATAAAWAQPAATPKGAPAQLVARGAVLMNGIVACGNCHQARGPQGQPLADKGLSGGQVFDEPPFKAVASNITPDRDTGIGRWTDAQLARAIREGVRPDGSVIGPPMPAEFYRHLSDADLKALIAWLRAQPAVAASHPKSEYRMPLPPAWGPPITKPVSAPPKKDSLRYCEYLAQIGHCMDCHSPRRADGRLVHDQPGAGGQVFSGPWGKSVARNLTPHDTGLKGWSDAEIERAIREGVRKDGSRLAPPMGFGYYRTIPADDMKALIAYLRSLPPQPMGGKI
jgi:mono/diheme cytochrome c family protein